MNKQEKFEHHLKSVDLLAQNRYIRKLYMTKPGAFYPSPNIAIDHIISVIDSLGETVPYDRLSYLRQPILKTEEETDTVSLSLRDLVMEKVFQKQYTPAFVAKFGSTRSINRCAYMRDFMSFEEREADAGLEHMLQTDFLWFEEAMWQLIHECNAYTFAEYFGMNDVDYVYQAFRRSVRLSIMHVHEDIPPSVELPRQFAHIIGTLDDLGALLYPPAGYYEPDMTNLHLAQKCIKRVFTSFRNCMVLVSDSQTNLCV